ncbi:TOM1 [Acrasis kona]|uniref:TOM1 n=1 Tax=Acrasis kona TaxID=1008807 RepID=A0AAW2YJJ3_9EUKA
MSIKSNMSPVNAPLTLLLLMSMLTLSYSQGVRGTSMVHTGFDDYKEYGIVKCTNATAGDDTCYQKLTMFTQAWTPYSYEPNYIFTVLLDANLTFRDTCNNKIMENMFENGVNCMKYMCPGEDTPQNRQYILGALQLYYDQSPAANESYQTRKDTFHIADNNLVRNFCLYCNHNTRAQFLQTLRTNSSQCPYFWKSQEDYCGKGLNYPAVLPHDTYNMMKRSVLYANFAARTDPKMANIRLNVFDDVLNLTVWRSKRPQDPEGEVSRGEFNYMCHCIDIQRLGSQCDGYTAFLIPFKYLALPFLTMFFRITLICIIVWLNYIPYICRDFPLLKDKQIKKFIVAHLGDLKVHAVLYMIVAVFIGLFEEPAYLTLHLTDSPYAQLSGLFRSLQYALTGLCLGSLLVLWSQIYDNTKNMTSGVGLNVKNIVFLGAFYVVFILILLTAIVGISITSFITTLPRSRDILFGCLLGVAIAFMTLFALGFFVYGIRMFFVIKQIETGVKLWDKKFMKFMIVADVFFFNFCCWLIIVTIGTTDANMMGIFMSLFAVYLMDINLSFLYAVVIFLLYDPAFYWNVPLYKALWCGRWIKSRVKVESSI